MLMMMKMRMSRMMIIIVIIIFAMKIVGGDGDNDHVFHVNDILGNVVETFGVTKVMPRIWVKPKKALLCFV